MFLPQSQTERSVCGKYTTISQSCQADEEDTTCIKSSAGERVWAGVLSALLDPNFTNEPDDMTAQIPSMMQFEQRDRLSGQLLEELKPLLREVAGTTG